MEEPMIFFPVFCVFHFVVWMEFWNTIAAIWYFRTEVWKFSWKGIPLVGNICGRTQLVADKLLFLLFFFPLRILHLMLLQSLPYSFLFAGMHWMTCSSLLNYQILLLRKQWSNCWYEFYSFLFWVSYLLSTALQVNDAPRCLKSPTLCPLSFVYSVKEETF